MTEHIAAITLEGMLPRVFEGEQIPESQVWNASLTFRKGNLYLVEAASGAGKSSLCAYIYGSRTDFRGRLLFDGKDVAGLTINRWQLIRRQNLAYLPQELALFPELTALQNISLKNSLTGFQPQEKIEEWLHMLGVDSRRDFPVGKMSVGQQQRVGIVRALCQPFDFLLLDEPVSHLDAANNTRATSIIMEEAGRQGAAVISTSVGNPLLLDNPQRLRL